MNQKYKSKVVLTIILLFFSLCFAIGKPVTWISDKSVEAANINSLIEQQEKIEKQLALLQKEKEALKDKSAELKGALSWLNNRTAEERTAYNKLVDELNDAYTEMDNALAEAKSAEDDVQKKQAQYKKRLQIMFENRNKGTLEMLFEAKDINGFMANIKFISIIADNDQKVLNELISAKDEAFLKRKAAEEYCAEIQIYVNTKNKEIEALKKNLTKTQSEIANKTKELLQKEKAEKELLEESNAIAAAIKKLQSSAKYYGGEMVWPTPGYSGISAASGFGMRLHPIYKYWRMHNGVDINAPFEAKIVAVADGKVIIAKTISGYNHVTGNNYGGTNYGNYIIIDHGGGISTAYAHCKFLKVNVGDIVKTGQWIGIVGSTGLSTGAHLHFEVRESGNPVNPLQKKYLGVKGN